MLADSTYYHIICIFGWLSSTKNWRTQRSAADSTSVFSLLATMFSIVTTTLQMDTTQSLIVKQTQGGCGLGPLRYHI